MGVSWKQVGQNVGKALRRMGIDTTGETFNRAVIEQGTAVQDVFEKVTQKVSLTKSNNK
jgi:hypothetical protein